MTKSREGSPQRRQRHHGLAGGSKKMMKQGSEGMKCPEDRGELIESTREKESRKGELEEEEEDTENSKGG